MKKTVLFGLLATVLVLSSCDKVKDTIDGVKDLGDVKEPTYVDEGLKITVNFKEAGLETTWEAKFQADKADTICIAYQMKEKFSLESAAKIAYNEIMEEADSTDIIKFDGSKTLTADYSSWVGSPKVIVAAALKTIYHSYVKAYEESKKLK